MIVMLAAVRNPKIQLSHRCETVTHWLGYKVSKHTVSKALDMDRQLFFSLLYFGSALQCFPLVCLQLLGSRRLVFSCYVHLTTIALYSNLPTVSPQTS